MLRELAHSIWTFRGSIPRLKPIGNAAGVTLITCCRNAETTIERTLASVAAQTSPVEHLVIDGASSDGTADLARRSAARVISEPDAGIYDAFNKGVRFARGEFIAFVHADDWIEPDFVEKSLAAISDADFTYGDVAMHDSKETVLRNADHNWSEHIEGVTNLHHPTMLVRRRVFEEIGLFRPGLKIAGDFDWFQRLHRGGFRGAYSGVRVHMTHGGASTSRQELSILEAIFVALANKGRPRVIFRWWWPRIRMRLVYRTKQLMSAIKKRIVKLIFRRV